jgi:isoamylase
MARPNGRALCFQLDASEDGSHLGVDRLFFILNADHEPQWVTLPPLARGHAWHRAIDTSIPGKESFADAGREIRLDPSDHYIANPRSTVVLLASASS